MMMMLNAEVNEPFSVTAAASQQPTRLDKVRRNL